MISTENGEGAEEIVEEFQKLWNSEYALPYDDFYEVYKERYNIIKHQREIAKSEETGIADLRYGSMGYINDRTKSLDLQGFQACFFYYGQ